MTFTLVKEAVLLLFAAGVRLEYSSYVSFLLRNTDGPLDFVRVVLRDVSALYAAGYDVWMAFHLGLALDHRCEDMEIRV